MLSDEIVKHAISEFIKEIKPEQRPIQISDAKQELLLDSIYKELKDEADEGEYLIFEKTATTKVDILFMKDLLGHYAKGYTLKNDGLIDIQFGHNLDLSKRYTNVSPTSEASFSFNRKKIRSIYIKTNSGTSNYTLTLIW